MSAIFEIGFLLNQAVSLAALIFIQYTNGMLAEYKNVKVNYTRKINHFTLFVIPIILNRGYAIEQSYGLFALGATLAVLKFIFYIKPIRDRVPFIRVMFSSFDRPEDRPHTLLWLSTQTAMGYLVLIPMGIVFAHYGIMELILIPILIYGIGDGLAEPVGVRFGKHKYAAYALFSDKKYHRTLEGSACVLITGIIVVIFHSSFFTPTQLFAAIGAVPLLMTLAEAVSPHTWDSPIMFFVGGLSLLGISFL